MRGSGGALLVMMMMMCMFVIVLAVIGYFEYNKRSKKSGEDEGGSPGELVITEDGASMTEGYRIMPKTRKICTNSPRYLVVVQKDQRTIAVDMMSVIPMVLRLYMT
jgi:hypothetical protein